MPDDAPSIQARWDKVAASLSGRYTIVPDQASVTAMVGALSRLARETTYDMHGIVREGAVAFVRSARKRTPVGQRLRPVRQAPTEDQRQGQWEVEKYINKSGPPVWVRTRVPRRVRVIGRRGLARQSWGWMLRGLGRSAGTSAKSPAQFHLRFSPSHVVRGGVLGGAYVDMRNRLYYIAIIAPDIMTESLSAAARAIQHRLDGRLFRQMKRAFEG